MKVAHSWDQSSVINTQQTNKLSYNSDLQGMVFCGKVVIICSTSRGGYAKTVNTSALNLALSK